MRKILSSAFSFDLARKEAKRVGGKAIKRSDAVSKGIVKKGSSGPFWLIIER